MQLKTGNIIANYGKPLCQLVSHGGVDQTMQKGKHGMRAPIAYPSADTFGPPLPRIEVEVHFGGVGLRGWGDPP